MRVKGKNKRRRRMRKTRRVMKNSFKSKGRRRMRKSIKTRKNTFKSVVNKVRHVLQKTGKKDIKSDYLTGYRYAKRIIKKSKVKAPRVIPLPTQQGGFLPMLVSLFAVLGALGSLSGGISSVVSSINKTKNEKATLDELKRHNLKMEAVQVGKGLYLNRYKSGFGLYINEKKKGQF